MKFLLNIWGSSAGLCNCSSWSCNNSQAQNSNGDFSVTFFLPPPRPHPALSQSAKLQTWVFHALAVIIYYFFLNLQIDSWTMVTEVWILWKDVLLPPSSESQINLAFLLQLHKLYNSLWSTCTPWIKASHMISFVPAFV